MILCVNPTVDGYEEIQVNLFDSFFFIKFFSQHALKFGELTKEVMVPRALPPPPPPPIPPKIIRAGALREIDNQQQQNTQQPVIFTEFK